MINIKIPFIKSDAKTEAEKKYHKAIQQEAWTITKKAMLRTLTNKDVDKLERMYADYFKKYPDTTREKSSKERIKKLRQII